MKTSRSATHLRRGLAQRPFLLFALLLCLPALAFGFLGWRSVEREGLVAEREASAEAADALEARLRTVAAELEAIGSREAERPYYHYQLQYAPEDTVFQELAFQTTPLIRAPGDSRIRHWFQWELGAKGVPDQPEVFGAQEDVTPFVEAYGPYLRAKLAEVSGGANPLFGRPFPHALRIVQANEERGQLIEELQIVRQERGAAEPPPTEAQTTPYLRSFFARVGDEPVAVRYGPFRYVGARVTVPPAAPTLAAWRVVWIPAAHLDRREVGRDRWLLQGYVLAPERLLPSSWATIGSVQLCRLDVAEADPRCDEALRPNGAGEVEYLTGWLDADLVPAGDDAEPAASSLALAAVPDAETLSSARAMARTRFLLLLAGVLVVVGVGFVVLTRGLRREIALARRKEDFVAAVSHELKTPLAGIRMYADMLREGWVADEESANRYATRIIDESDRLGHLVDQVLDLAALERGVAQANAVAGNLGAAVEDAVGLCRPRAVQAGVALDVDVEADLPLVTFDPRLVRPLVLNLVDNGIKYSEHAPEKQVDVRVRRDDGGVIVEVADRGVGVDPKVRRHLFEPFHRAGDEMTRSTTGVGIGLALVKRYADAHRAKVTLESEVGRGTTVRVRFPV